MVRLSALALAAILAVGGPQTARGAGAGPLVGDKTVRLVAGDGTARDVARLRFSGGDGGRVGYELVWLDAPFSDHFLSMRPFRCLEGPDKHWCQVPYPYENRRSVSRDDLRDLEYDLLFLWKGASEYGINMWNGVYYQLSVDGDRLVGQLKELNMDLLSAPPEPGDLRPIGAGDLHDGDPDSHWLPKLVIE